MAPSSRIQRQSILRTYNFVIDCLKSDFYSARRSNEAQGGHVHLLSQRITLALIDGAGIEVTTPGFARDTR
jgi:hypothetical protein